MRSRIENMDGLTGLEQGSFNNAASSGAGVQDSQSRHEGQQESPHAALFRIMCVYQE
ncbi:unnamed protein product, partial [Amoebophrya sp. A25]|eukprot:GSA25T00010678001.1